MPPVEEMNFDILIETRRKVERAMPEGIMRAVMCSSTLDLGIGSGVVDLVLQIGAPIGTARLIQRDTILLDTEVMLVGDDIS